jgi:hypothetical protein
MFSRDNNIINSNYQCNHIARLRDSIRVWVRLSAQIHLRDTKTTLKFYKACQALNKLRTPNVISLDILQLKNQLLTCQFKR